MLAIKTLNYKLAKTFVSILKSLSNNQYKVKDSYAFAEEIVEQGSEFFMESLDVDSLFTNIPFKEAHHQRLLTSALIHFLKMRKK